MFDLSEAPGGGCIVPHNLFVVGWVTAERGPDDEKTSVRLGFQIYDHERNNVWDTRVHLLHSDGMVERFDVPVERGMRTQLQRIHRKHGWLACTGSAHEPRIFVPPEGMEVIWGFLGERRKTTPTETHVGYLDL